MFIIEKKIYNLSDMFRGSNAPCIIPRYSIDGVKLLPFERYTVYILNNLYSVECEHVKAPPLGVLNKHDKSLPRQKQNNCVDSDSTYYGSSTRIGMNTVNVLWGS